MTEKRYLCDGPFSAKTQWVVCPLNIRVKDKHFNGALAQLKELLVALGVSLELQPQGASVELLPMEGQFQDCQPNISLISGDKETQQVSTEQYVVLRFTGDCAFWSKAEAVAAILDQLSVWIDRYRGNKLIDFTR